MEEDILKKKENKLEEKGSKNKKIVILIISLIIIALIGAGAYFLFFRNDSQQIESNGEIRHIQLGSTNKEVLINNKKVNLRMDDYYYHLYVNDVKYEDIIFEGNIFVTDNYALIAGVGQNGYGIDYAVDENGNVINVYNSIVTGVPYGTCQVNNIRNEKGKIVAERFDDSCSMMTSDTENCESKVEFVYDGNYINIVDMSLSSKKQPLTRMTLTGFNQVIKFNDEYVKLRGESDKIYFNDKLVKDFGGGYGSFGVYVSNNLIFIFWVGQQCDAVFIGAIDKDGKFVEVENKDYIPVYGVYSENGVVNGTGYECTTEEGESFPIKYTYDGKKVTIKKVENNNNSNGNNNNNNTNELDLSKISTNSIKVLDFNPTKLDTLQGEKSFDIGESTLSVNYDGTKAIVKFQNDSEKMDRTFYEVSKVYYWDYGNCEKHVVIVIMTDEKIYLADSWRLANDMFNEISNSKKYVDIYMGHLHTLTCDFMPFWLGKTSDGKYYDLSTSTEYLSNTYVYYDDGNNYVKKDKSYKLGKNTGKIKVMFLGVEENLKAYIDDNNYLYIYEKDDNGNGSYKKASNNKVVRIEKSEFDSVDYITEFANGGKKEISYVDVYK